MPVHHVKGQPAAPTYVQKKRCFTFHTNRETPCTTELLQGDSQLVSKVDHPFFRTYVDIDAAGCPFKCWTGIVVDLIFKIFF